MQELLNKCTDFADEFNVTFGEEKCNVIHYRDLEVQDVKPVYMLQGRILKETDNYTYLGIIISNNKDNYLDKTQEKLIKKANKQKWAVQHTANFSYNRYSVGRTLWKAVGVPSLTYGNEAIVLNKQTRDHIERVQREVGRRMLGANHITPNLAIEGEMGWSTMEAREAKSKIKFKGRLIFMEPHRYPKIIFNFLRFGGQQTEWMKRTRNLDNIYGRGTERTTRATFKEWEVETEKDVKRNQEKIWREGVQKKESLRRYSKKERPSQEHFYDNYKGSELLFQARVGSLLTAVREMKIFGSVNNECKLCQNKEAEDLEHILLRCSALTSKTELKKLREEEIAVSVAIGLETGEKEWDLNDTKNILIHWQEKKKSLLALE